MVSCVCVCWWRVKGPAVYVALWYELLEVIREYVQSYSQAFHYNCGGSRQCISHAPLNLIHCCSVIVVDEWLLRTKNNSFMCSYSCIVVVAVVFNNNKDVIQLNTRHTISTYGMKQTTERSYSLPNGPKTRLTTNRSNSNALFAYFFFVGVYNAQCSATLSISRCYLV